MEKVTSLTLNEIESAVWKDKDQPVSRILFRLSCAARITVRSTYGNLLESMLRKSTTYTVGGVKNDKPEAYLKIATSDIRDRVLTIKLYGEAQLTKIHGGGWELNKVKVDRTLPQDDMVELSRMK